MQLTDAVIPDAGDILQLELGPVAEVTVRFVGKSVTTILVASFGPALETVIV